MNGNRMNVPRFEHFFSDVKFAYQLFIGWRQRCFRVPG